MSLEFMRIGQTEAPPPAEWVWKNRFALGAVTMIGGPGGVGKSSIMAALEISIALGLPFLGTDTTEGEVIHVDFDTTLGQQFPWYQKAAKGMGLSSTEKQKALDRITYAPPLKGGMLTLERLEQLGKQVTARGARLVVIDAFTSAFGFIRGNVAEDVNEVMAALRQLAALNIAVVVLDHTPKPAKNDVEGRGLLGSTMKAAGARAVHLLSRVQPKEVAGLDVLRLETHKNNLAPIGDAVGVQRVWDGSDSVKFELYELPDEVADLGKEARARKLIVKILDDKAGEVFPRKTILEQVIEAVNATEKTVKRAISAAITAEEINFVQIGGQGNQVGYTSILPPETPPNDDQTGGSWEWGNSLSPNKDSTSDTKESLGTWVVPKDVPKQETASSTGECLGTSVKAPVSASTPAESLLISPTQITQPETKPLETIAEWGDD